jgi:hypothetical protein
MRALFGSTGNLAFSSLTPRKMLGRPVEGMLLRRHVRGIALWPSLVLPPLFAAPPAAAQSSVQQEVRTYPPGAEIWEGIQQIGFADNGLVMFSGEPEVSVTYSPRFSQGGEEIRRQVFTGRYQPVNTTTNSHWLTPAKGALIGTGLGAAAGLAAGLASGILLKIASGEQAQSRY